MPNLNEAQLEEKRLHLRDKELELERAKVFIEFAKYGFRGTLTAALLGLIVLFGLAALNAFAETKIETWGMVAIALIVMLGAVAFGYFSLWQLPKIAMRIKATTIDTSVGPGEESK